MKTRIKTKTPAKAVKVVALSRGQGLAPRAALPGAAPTHKNRPTGPGKTYHKDGHWIENPRKNTVLVCACGNRYLKTRHGQNKCLTCISQGR